MATISQRIALEGSEEIQKKLEELAAAGEKSFNKIQDAAQQFGGDTFAKFAQAIAAATEAMQTFATQIAEAGSKAVPALEKVGQAAEATSEGLTKVGEQGTKAAEGITAVGEAGKQATTEVANSGDAAEKSSASYANLALNVVRTGASVASATSGIASAGAATAALGVQAIGATAAVGTFALTLGSTLVGAIGAAVGALGVLGAALERIAFDDARLSDTLEHLATNARGLGQSFTSLQVGQQAFAQIGISGEKFRSVIGQLAKDLQSLKAGEVFEASAKRITDAATSVLEAQKKLLEVRIKQDLRGADEGMVQEVQSLIDRAQKTAELRDAEKGLADARKQQAKEQANNLTNIVELMQQVEGKTKAGDAFIGPVRPTFDALTTLETKIEAIKIRLQQVANAGGDVSKSLAKIIANLPKEDAFKVGAGFGLSETDVDRLQRYGSDLTKIDGLFAKIKAAGVLISPADAKTFEQMNESTQRLNSAWERLKQAWASTVFSGLAASGTSAINTITASVVEFTALSVESFNRFGSQLVTTLGQIGTGWGIIAGEIAEGWAIIGRATASMVTTAASGAWQWIGDTFNTAVGFVSTKIAEGKALIDAWVATPVASAWDWLRSTFYLATQGIEAIMAQTVPLIKAFVTTPVENAFAWMKDKFWEALSWIERQMRGGGAPAAPAAPAGGAATTTQALETTTDAIKTQTRSVKTWTEAWNEAMAAQNQRRAAPDALPAPAKLPELPKIEPYQAFLDVVGKIQQQIQNADNALTTFSRISEEKGTKDLRDSFAKIVELLPQLNQLGDAFKGVPEVQLKIRGIKDAIFELREEARGVGIFSPVSASADEAAAEVKKAFRGINLQAEVKPIEWSDIGQGASDAAAAINETLTAPPASGAWQWIKDTAASVWEQVKTAAQQAYQSVVEFVTTAPGNAWQWLKDSFQSVIDSIAEKWAAFKQSLGLGGGAPAGGGAAGGQVGGSAGFAGGGLLGGRGTGTSDSNLAWVSRGEHIMPARAVSQPGVLAFLEALRRSGGNLRDVLDGMGRFALGGMVRGPISIPAFAGGGMSNVTIQFPGLPEITGLRASSSVVDELRNAAAMAQVRSGGRKPSRYS